MMRWRAFPLVVVLVCTLHEPAAGQSLLGMQQVAEGVYVYTDSDGGTDPATVSSLVVVTDEGVLVGDGLGRVGDVSESDAMVGRLMAEIRKVTDQPIRYLVNSSWHPDHTNGNHLFRSAGATIVSLTRARDDLLQYYTTAPDVPKAPPDVVFDDRMTLFLGGEEIRLLYLGRAHTAADAVIYLPRRRVAFLSEIFFNKQFPGLRSGYPTEWVETLDRVLELDADVFIPGHGLVEDGGRLRSTVEQMRADLVEMNREIKGYFDQGLTRDQILERQPLQKLAGQINAYRNLPIAVDRILAELRAGPKGLP
jgi:glyoxylase-like metal-dependent hydrolase (beta-lactamase superfamily II)